MGFGDNDRNLMEKTSTFLKVVMQKNLFVEFSNKGWGLRGLNKTFEKAA